MINEDYVSFSSAILLKEKGFVGECSRFYMPNGNGRWKYGHYHDFDISERIDCPTLQMAMKWLRENKGVAIIPIISSILDNEKFLWDIKIVVAKNHTSFSQGWVYEKLEQAFEHAIHYSLENLI